MDAIAGAGGTYLYVMLFKNNITVGVGTRLVDLVEADYSGYARFNSAAWSAPAVASNDDVFTLSPTIIFQKTAGVPTNVIYGYAVLRNSGSGDALWFCQNFATPQNMIVSTDQIPIQVRAATRNLAA